MMSLCRRRPQNIFSAWPRTLYTQITSVVQPEPTELPPRTKRTSKPEISASVILNRSPILTRVPTPFERAFYTYQARIRRALSNPFPYKFYFGEGSLLRTRFTIEERERERRAWGPKFHTPTEEERAQMILDKVTDAQMSEQEGKSDPLTPRVHTADRENDVKSLDRSGTRNLYLLVLAREADRDIWRFPQGGVEKGELLHQAAQRDLYAEAGEHMDTWIVSRNPIGVYKQTAEPSGPEKFTFFFKAHIMAGQARLQSESIKDFAWLTKQEIEGRVDKDYWEGVKDILSDF
ncbi:39S mitochondrial ribosomal protein L46-domain-containing protein [Mycena floridula]|nr:39S mitochondrial ribosomal protein L46-domain-containing protein [Mycena floridula]